MQTSRRVIAKRAESLGSHADACIGEEPGAGKSHAGICAGQSGNRLSYRDGNSY